MILNRKLLALAASKKGTWVAAERWGGRLFLVRPLYNFRILNYLNVLFIQTEINPRS